MKKLTLLLAAALLLLSACGGGGKQADSVYDPAETAAALLDSSAFSEQIEELDLDIACELYGLAFEDLTGGVVYTSTGATAEEIAVFVFPTEAAAKAALPNLESRLADQKQACENYLPLEMPKLNAAILSQRGNSLLYVVAADAAAAQSTLDGLK